MKTNQTKKLAAIAAVCLALGGGQAWACEQHRHHVTSIRTVRHHYVAARPSRMVVCTSRPIAYTTTTRRVVAGDRFAPSGNFFADTVTFPFRFAGRSWQTVRRSPEIVGESLRGDRPFVSSGGFFARDGYYRDYTWRERARMRNIASPAHTETRGLYSYNY